MNDWIRLHSGGKFHFIDIESSTITIEDIAHNLSQICRYTGASRKFYSVAQHSCIVCDILPHSFKFCGLMHDTSESVTGDANSILKRLLPDFKAIEKKVEKFMAKKFDIPFPYPAIVKYADLIALASEMKFLMPGEDYKNIRYEPLPTKIIPWSISRSKREFLSRFRKLYKPVNS
jgi:5'-deoxynucleotidase YfbR-like HD superfamily hydrolase